MGANSVKYLHSGMTGAPALSGSAGALIAVLDACLVDGWGLATLDSLVIAGGVATATRAAGHPFEAGQVSQIAGAAVTGGTINGERRVLSTTATTYTFDATGISDQAATGTITHKVAAAGWSKEFSGTNLAVYKSTDSLALGFRLRVNDTGTTDARVVGYESMSDANTGSGPFPTDAQMSGGGYWAKSSTANSAERSWVLVADERTFYFAPAWDAVNPTRNSVFTFGDFLAEGSTDVYHGYLVAMHASAPFVGHAAVAPHSVFSFAMANNTNGLGGFCPRSHTGLGSAVGMRRTAALFVCTSPSTTFYSGANSDLSQCPYPNGPNGALYATPIVVCNDAEKSFRGTLPGVWSIPQSIVDGTFTTRNSVQNVSGLSGRTLKAIVTYYGVGLVDITGPWR